MSQRRRNEKKVEVHPAPENTKEALLLAARQLFASMGYAGTTVKDISEKAGVNVSLVSYHFQGKEGLYRAVLEHLGSERLSMSQRILLHPSSVEEFRVRLQMYVSEILQWLVDEPDLCVIVQREIDSGLPLAKDIFTNTFLKIFDHLHDFLTAAKKEKMLRSDVDPLTAASVIHGSLMQIGRSDWLSKELFGLTIQDELYRKKLIEQVIPFYVNGLIKEKI